MNPVVEVLIEWRGRERTGKHVHLKRIRTLSRACKSGGWWRGGVIMLAACFLAPGLAAQEVYRSVDEHGVVSFSDVASEDAVRLELPATEVRQDALAELQARIALQLEVAKALEASRLAREAARMERLEALADSEPRTIYYREEDRYVDSWGYWSGGYWPGYGRPGHRPPLRPVHPIEPPPEMPSPPSRRVPLPPLNPD